MDQDSFPELDLAGATILLRLLETLRTIFFRRLNSGFDFFSSAGTSAFFLDNISLVSVNLFVSFSTVVSAICNSSLSIGQLRLFSPSGQ